ncbi:uncharacterized protein BJ171DRAFT_212837 [Polychytrium aggregatum]|uniref:uncharacterized protein n=1 Tax=Polychytrium aggregatum TaxID=110093 RepID=UPI0022FEF16E|nr:uncharacterized protein BJ171DRAFT_212837 [Polychytrium aggregatum]KAI9208737.1 hypothetical protein BJ171DRAFT_212837 [Polychytrium aggregatum]
MHPHSPTPIALPSAPKGQHTDCALVQASGPTRRGHPRRTDRTLIQKRTPPPVVHLDQTRTSLPPVFASAFCFLLLLLAWAVWTAARMGGPATLAGWCCLSAAVAPLAGLALHIWPIFSLRCPAPHSCLVRTVAPVFCPAAVSA